MHGQYVVWRDHSGFGARTTVEVLAIATARPSVMNPYAEDFHLRSYAQEVLNAVDAETSFLRCAHGATKISGIPARRVLTSCEKSV